MMEESNPRDFESDKIAFHQAFLSEGGRFPYEQLQNIDKIFERQKKNLYELLAIYQSHNPKIPKINIDFIYNTELNAKAAKYNSNYFIGINCGTFFLAFDLFQRFMSSPNILPLIGNVKAEVQTKKIYNAQLTDFKQLMIQERNEPISPNDQTRLMYAMLFTDRVMEFVFHHEYYHVVNGHLDLIGENRKMFAISENAAPTIIDPIVMQTLEMDSDCNAVSRSINLLDSWVKTENKIPVENLFYSDLETAISNWLFAVYTFFRIFGFRDYTSYPLPSYKHPPSGIRQQLIFGTLATMFQSRPEKNMLERIPNICVSILDAVENAFAEVSEVEMDRLAIAFAYTSDAQNHIKVIMNNWNDLRPKLLKYATVDLAPPDTWV
jgi:hypothetical protein